MFRFSFTLAVFLLSSLASCAKPTTYRPTVSLPELQGEITFQLKKDYQATRRQQDRVERIAVPLLIAGAPFCSETGTSFGFSYFDRKSLDPLDYVYRNLFIDYYAKRRVGSERPGEYPYVIEVYKGFGAEKTGLLKGDRILEIEGQSVKPFYRIVKKKEGFTGKKVRKKKWMNTMGHVLVSVGPKEKTRFKIKRSIEYEVVSDNHKGIIQTYRDTTLELFISQESSCSNRVLFVNSGEVNAYTDGKNIAVTSGMLRFASDEELSLIIAHELAHCVEKHVRKKKAISSYRLDLFLCLCYIYGMRKGIYL